MEPDQAERDARVVRMLDELDDVETRIEDLHSVGRPRTIAIYLLLLLVPVAALLAVLVLPGVRSFTPFLIVGDSHQLLELPPATLRIGGMNLQVAGGGYFRLFPLAVMNAGVKQLLRTTRPGVAMLYFHPWEFDPDQPRLPAGRLRRFRHGVNLHRTQDRLRRLLRDFRFGTMTETLVEYAACGLAPARRLASAEPQAAKSGGCFSSMV